MVAVVPATARVEATEVLDFELVELAEVAAPEVLTSDVDAAVVVAIDDDTDVDEAFEVEATLVLATDEVDTPEVVATEDVEDAKPTVVLAAEVVELIEVATFEVVTPEVEAALVVPTDETEDVDAATEIVLATPVVDATLEVEATEVEAPLVLANDDDETELVLARAVAEVETAALVEATSEVEAPKVELVEAPEVVESDEVVAATDVVVDPRPCRSVTAQSSPVQPGQQVQVQVLLLQTPLP